MSILTRLQKGAEEQKNKGAKTLEQHLNDGSDAGNYAYRKAMESQYEAPAPSAGPAQPVAPVTPAAPVIDMGNNATVTTANDATATVAPAVGKTPQEVIAERQAQLRTSVAPDGKIMVDENSVQTPDIEAVQNNVPTKVSGFSAEEASKQLAAANDQSKLTDLEYLQSFMPINKDEEEKRARAATAANGLGALSQAAAAFANYAYSDAPAITLKEFKGADVEKWQDKLREQRLQYLKMKMGIDQNELNKGKVLQDMELARNADRRADNADERAGNADRRADELHGKQIEGMGYDNTIKKYKSENMPTEIDLENRAKEASIGASKASANAANASAAATRAKTLNEKQNEIYYVPVGADVIPIDKRKVNVSVIAKVHSKLRDENGKAIPTTETKTKDTQYGPMTSTESKGLDAMLKDIGRYIDSEGSKEALDYLRKNVGNKGKAKINY